jgi:hypothetical protein
MQYCSGLAMHFLPSKYRDFAAGDTDELAMRYDTLDSVGKLSRRTASAGLHGGMTSPARPWFRLGLPDDDLTKYPPVKMFLDELQRRMRRVFSRSNFYLVIQQIYDELLTFGTALMLELPHPRYGIYFKNRTMGTYHLATDHRGFVDTLFWQQALSAKQIVDKYGLSKCSEAVKRAYDKASSTHNLFEVVTGIVPRATRNPYKLNNKNFPFASYHFEGGESANTENFLRVAGFRELPGFGVRWDVTGEDVWGQSPAMDVLGHHKQLERMTYNYIMAEEKHNEPPLAVPDGVDAHDLIPGGTVAVTSTGESGKQVYPIHETKPNPQGTLVLIQDIRQQIREGMYYDLFRMLSRFGPKTNMTATEVAERHEEKLLQLGPILERLHSELFSPMIDRTFNIMLDNDMVPPWPEELSNMPLQVDFISILAQAQKMVNTNAVDQFTTFIGANAQLDRRYLDVPNPDKVGDAYADYLGIDPSLLTTEKEREQVRTTRAQQEQQQRQMEMAAQGAQTAKVAADTPVQGGESTALDALLAGAGGSGAAQ